MPREPQDTGAHYPAPTLCILLGMVRCSPSCRCPDGRCLPARSGGYNRARNPHGCHCRRSRASKPGSRTRKSTELGGGRHPEDAAPLAREVVKGVARREECSGLWTPASWCRAQGRARRPPGAGLRRGHGRTNGRAHLAWHRLVVPAARPLRRRLLNPPARRAPAHRASCHGDWGGANPLLTNEFHALLPG